MCVLVQGSVFVRGVNGGLCGGAADAPGGSPVPHAPTRHPPLPPQVRGHAVEVLQATDDDELLYYLLQLVQVGGLWRG